MFASGIFLAVLVVGLALLGLWISSLRPPPSMSFDFLKGRAVVARIECDPRKSPLASIHQYYSSVQYYSFEADFSDICKAADAELLAFGFKSHTHSIEGYKYRTYVLNEATSSKIVIIFDRQRFVGFPSAQLRKSSIAEGNRCERRDGWVTVRIERGRLPLWPPRYLLYRLKRPLQADENGNNRRECFDFSFFGCSENIPHASMVVKWASAHRFGDGGASILRSKATAKDESPTLQFLAYVSQLTDQMQVIRPLIDKLHFVQHGRRKQTIIQIGFEYCCQPKL